MKGKFFINQKTKQRIYLTREQIEYDKMMGGYDDDEWQQEDEHEDEREAYEIEREEERQLNYKLSRR